ncbi:MAG TPA: phosphatidylinositol mannoside acyltransferase [Acidimicrobiales bacterium]|nr:phosphatidylinositol mannoside acyltransferase [Acidimicrobiales bacterium]
MTKPPTGRAPSPVSERLVYLGYRGGAALLRHLPAGIAASVAAAAGVGAGLLGPRRRQVVEDNLRHVVGPIAKPALGRLALAAFADYGRYWADAARLGARQDEPSSSFTIAGDELIGQALAGGRGCVLALPHLGCWEVGGLWLAQNRRPLTTVVEGVHPPELFRWFVDSREALGIHVVELGPRAVLELLAALRQGKPVALLADRDLTGDGIEVELFGAPTTMPGGPAVVALRGGAPLLPCAVYHLGAGRHHALVRPALDTTRRGRLGEDARRITQDLAHELEDLIRLAPSQWHVLQPRWASASPGVPGATASAAPQPASPRSPGAPAAPPAPQRPAAAGST